MSDHPKISANLHGVQHSGLICAPQWKASWRRPSPILSLLLVHQRPVYRGSAEVCDALAAQDARIRVFHQANGGPAHARNTGLDNVRGDYIGIVDSDDLIEPTMFETLYNAVQAPGVRLAACAAD